MLMDDGASGAAIVSAELMFDVCVPNQNLLSRALAFNANELDNLSEVDLAKFILVLGQYLVTLKYRENEIAVRKAHLTRVFTRDAMKIIKSRKWKTNVPLKEKLGVISEENPALRELELKKDQAESEFIMVSGMYSAFLEYLNAYKKEQSRRQPMKVFEGR